MHLCAKINATNKRQQTQHVHSHIAQVKVVRPVPADVQCQNYGKYFIVGSFLDIGDRIARTPDLTKPRLDLEPCSCKDRTPKTLLDSSKKEFPQLKVALQMPLHFEIGAKGHKPHPHPETLRLSCSSASSCGAPR